MSFSFDWNQNVDDYKVEQGQTNVSYKMWTRSLARTIFDSMAISIIWTIIYWNSSLTKLVDCALEDFFG